MKDAGYARSIVISYSDCCLKRIILTKANIPLKVPFQLLHDQNCNNRRYRVNLLIVLRYWVTNLDKDNKPHHQYYYANLCVPSLHNDLMAETFQSHHPILNFRGSLIPRSIRKSDGGVVLGSS